MTRICHRVIALLLGCALLAGAGCAAAEKTVTISFTGDCTLGSEEATRKDPYSFDSMAEKEGYDYFFANFREMFEKDDITFINFEGVLSDSQSQQYTKKRYRFRGPTDFVKILTGSSVELAGLANNHTGDYGKQGEQTTKETLEQNGIEWAQESKYYIYEKDGIRIAFFALHNKWINSNFEKFKQILLRLKQTNEVDAIVATWHTGKEYRGAHESGKYSTENTAKRMIQYGVDLLIMHHPHVLQGIDIANNRTICYSLGNFVFGGNDEIRNEKFLIDKTVTSLYSMVVQAKLTFGDDGTYLGQQVTLYPAYTSSGEKQGERHWNNYQPFRANAEQAVPIRDAIQLDTTFDLPEITTDADGLSRMEMPYLPAFEEAMIPESEDDLATGPQGVPEAASPAPTRENKGN